VGGAVGTRRDLDLARLQRSVFSEMIRHATTRNGATSVPADYRVRLHPDDHVTVAQAPGFFTQGLEQAMASAGRKHGWTVPSRLRIELVPDRSRRRGVPTVEADAAPMAAGPGQPPAPRTGIPSAQPAAQPARLERDGGDGRNGEAIHELRTDTVTIGRGTDRTIRVDDSRASRRHATLRREGDGWTLTDEGSSNGTRLDGETIAAGRPRVLHDGHEIGVGPVTFVFRAQVAGVPDIGELPPSDDRTLATRVLDEQQRRSISQDFFPLEPPRRPGP